MKKMILAVIPMLLLCLCFSGCDNSKTGAMTGDVVDVSEASIEIATQNGETYQFSLSDLDKGMIAGGEALAKGDNVTVHYKGETDDDNLVQTVTVLEIKLNKKADTANSQNPGTPNNENQANQNNTNNATNTDTGNTGGARGENSIKGEIVDAAMETIVIRATDGNTYSFNKETATENLDDDGLVIGEDVIITYNGTLDPNNEITAISITED